MFSSHDTPGRARLLASAMLVVTFAVGALAGAAGERMLGAREPGTKTGGAPRSMHRGSILLEPCVLDLLQATPDQRTRVKHLLASRDSQTVAIWSEVEPRYRHVFDETRKEIRAVLSAGQKVTLDSMIDARRQRPRPTNQESKSRDRCAEPGAQSPESAKTK